MNLPRTLAIIVCLVGILYWSQELWQGNNEPTVFDLPKTLEEEVLTLEVFPVSNVNDVPVFTTSVGSSEDDWLYLTPASDSADIPVNFVAMRDSGYTMQVHGKFFQGTGIPAEYLHVKPKPERLRVFQFDRINFVLPKQNI